MPDHHYIIAPSMLSRAKALEGAWILYYRPLNAQGPHGYFAVARVEQVQTDPIDSRRHIAFIASQSFLEFPRPVPLSAEGVHLEKGLLNDVGALSGRMGSAVRQIDRDDFDRILALGLSDIDPDRSQEAVDPYGPGMREPQALLIEEPVVRGHQLSSRALREPAFRRTILEIYLFRCALTGLAISIKRDDGKTDFEVDAAHIWSVASGGPDTRSNGIALCKTVHWSFDNGLLSIGEEFEILVSSRSGNPSMLHHLINSTGRLLLPEHRSDWPSPEYLRWHREVRFQP